MRLTGSILVENLCIALVSFAACQLSRLLGFESTSVSLFWPSTTLAVVLVLRRGWLTLPGSLGGLAAWIVFVGHPVQANVLATGGLAIACITGCLMLEWLQRRKPKMSLVESLATTLATAIFIVAPIGAFVGSVAMKNHELARASRIEFWFGYWIVEAISAAMFLPALLHCIPPVPKRVSLYPSPNRRPNQQQPDRLAVGAALAMSGASLWLAINGNTTWAMLMLSIQIPLCFLIGLKTSLQGASVVMMIGALSILTVHTKLTGHELTPQTQADSFRLVLLVFEALLMSHFGWTLVSERARQADLLKKIANENELSGLPNRRAVTTSLRLLHERSSALALIEIQIRDLYRWADVGGYETISRIERNLGERIDQAFNSDRLAMGHIGTGRYIVAVDLATSDDDIQSQLKWAVSGAQFLVAGRHISLDYHCAVIDISAVAKPNASHMLSACALAMQEAITNRSAFIRRPYSEQHSTDQREALERIETVKSSLSNNRIRLMAQPIFAVEPGYASARTLSRRAHLHYEILTRLLDENGNELSPAWFLPAISRGGLLQEFDRAVLRNAFTYLSQDRQLQNETAKFSVNVTGQTLCDPTFADYVKAVLRETGLDPHAVIIEVTETDSIVDFAIAKAQLRSLEAVGIGCAVDDFGVGLATFEYLKKLRPQWIKIDGSFVRSLGLADADPLDTEIITAAVRAAKALGAQTVAEHVESQVQVDLLSSLGVDYLQGFFLAKPVRIESVRQSFPSFYESKPKPRFNTSEQRPQHKSNAAA